MHQGKYITQTDGGLVGLSSYIFAKAIFLALIAARFVVSTIDDFFMPFGGKLLNRPLVLISYCWCVRSRQFLQAGRRGRRPLRRGAINNCRAGTCPRRPRKRQTVRADRFVRSRWFLHAGG